MTGPVDHDATAWSANADAYEAVFEPLTRHYAERLVEQIDITPGERALDVACGPGVLTLAARGRGAEVLAVDFAPAMVERVSRRAGGGGPGVRTAVMDAAALDLADAEFDLAVSGFGVIFVPDVRRGITEMVRVTRRGGRVGLTAWTTPERFEPAALFGLTVLEVAGPQPPSDDDAFHWPEPEDLARDLIGAGLADVEIAVESTDWVVRDVGAFRRFVETSPASRRRLEALTPEVRTAVLAALVDDMARRCAGGPARLSVEAYVATGTVR